MMMQLMQNILLISLIVSAMIVVVLLIRRVISRKATVGFVSFLWMLVVLRLCIPVMLESPVHLGDTWPAKPVHEVNVQTADEDKQSGSGPAPAPVMPFSQSTAYPKLPHESDSGVQTKAVTHAPFDMWPLVFTVWLAGLITVLTLALRENILFGSHVKKNSTPVQDQRILCLAEKHKAACRVSRPVELRCLPVSMPMAAGVIRPRILLPDQMISRLTYEQMDDIILHEMCHIRRQDNLKNMLGVLGKALHWFNPLVWVCVKKMKEDMELSCDQSVIKHLDTSRTVRYCETLLCAARFMNGSKQALPAMRFCENKSKLKDRVDRMVKPKKRSKPVAVVSVLLAVVMMLTCFTTACQPTPEEAPVVNKGDGNLEEMIASSAASPVPTVVVDPALAEAEQNEALQSALRERLGASETYADSFENDKGDVTVTFDDATVAVPAAQSIPVVKVNTCAFSQEQVDRIAAYFLKDAPLYVKDDTMTKDELETLILQLEAQWQANIDLQDEESKKGHEGYINDLKKQYEAAPEEHEKTPATTELTKTKYGMGLRVTADLGKDEMAEFSVSNGDDRKSLIFENMNGAHYQPMYGEEPKETAESMTMTREEAKALVTQCLEDIGLGDMQINTISVADVIDFSHTGGESRHNLEDQKTGQCYVFDLQRIFNDIPVPSVATSVQMDTDDPNVEQKEPVYSEAVPAEFMQIVVDDTGIVSFSWGDPSETGEMLSENVTLMPFNEVIEKAKENIFYKNYTAYGSTCHIHITQIKLSLMRVMKKDAPGEYMLLPVWDFIGNHEHIMNGKSDWMPFGDGSYVTINAIDGSQINRGMGY